MFRGFTKNEKITLIISVIALLFSSTSWAYNTIYTIQKDRKDDMELLDIKLINVTNEHTVLYQKMELGELGAAIIPINYEILLSNNSKRTISVIDHNIEELRDGSSFYYSKLINSVSVDKEELEYPIKIDEGESKKITFSINILINQEVNECILKKYEYNTRIKYEELIAYLHESGYDIYGNQVKVNFYNDGTSIGKSVGIHSTPIYNVIFTSAKNNHFSKLLKHEEILEGM